MDKQIRILTVKDKHAAVMPSVRPFLVSWKGPNFHITYEKPPSFGGNAGSEDIAGGGVRVWTRGGTPSVPNETIKRSKPEKNAILPSWSCKKNRNIISHDNKAKRQGLQ